MAISTTGHAHRIPLLKKSVCHWDRVLEPTDALYVTVDGDEEATARVAESVSTWTTNVVRVGQPLGAQVTYDGRLGVAANKNTGIEYLMDHAECDRLWLSDDDTWPLKFLALIEHYRLGLPHSMLGWGAHRKGQVLDWLISWPWPRGSVLYVERSVVLEVGGMIEAFGPGGHEHVEWSRRIHQRGLTPVLYPSPISYAENDWMGAAALWYSEDMPLPGERLHELRRRRDTLTSVFRDNRAATWADHLMRTYDRYTGYVPYRAEDNNRSSATMIPL